VLKVIVFNNERLKVEREGEKVVKDQRWNWGGRSRMVNEGGGGDQENIPSTRDEEFAVRGEMKMSADEEIRQGNGRNWKEH